MHLQGKSNLVSQHILYNENKSSASKTSSSETKILEEVRNQYQKLNNVQNTQTSSKSSVSKKRRCNYLISVFIYISPCLHRHCIYLILNSKSCDHVWLYWLSFLIYPSPFYYKTNYRFVLYRKKTFLPPSFPEEWRQDLEKFLGVLE